MPVGFAIWLCRLAFTICLGITATFVQAQAAAAQPEPELMPLRLQLKWHHQAQFAGVYVAQAKGFYEDAGLAVEAVEAGAGMHPAELLGQGAVDAALAVLPAALSARANGWDIVNVAQIFRTPGLAIFCRHDSGIRRVEDVAGKTIGVSNGGDEMVVRHWLAGLGLSEEAFNLVGQRPDGRDLIEGQVDCGTGMMYNEYWSILDGMSPSDVVTFRLAESGLGLMEDGIYVRRDSLNDPVQRQALSRFVAATTRGWAYALENVDEAYAISMAKAGSADPEHQRLMLNTVLRLIGPADRIGLIDVGAFDRSIEVIAAQPGNAALVNAAVGAWTQKLWYESGRGQEHYLSVSDATRYRISEIVDAHWFFGVVMAGAVVFAFAGFMRGQQRQYDLWGLFILTFLPAAGGGIIRDLLVGGDRYPPFIIQDPTYIYVVFGTFLAGILMNRFIDAHTVASRGFDSTMKVFDTLGFAAFAVVGAKVAVIAGLSWIWVPICCAVTCAGGGMISDIITGREPRTFRGEPYEELAIIGGLFMLAGLQIADAYEHVPWITTVVIIATLILIFLMRGAAIVFEVKFHPFARHQPAAAPAIEDASAPAASEPRRPRTPQPAPPAKEEV